MGLWFLADGAETLVCGERAELVDVGSSVVDLELCVYGVIGGFALVMDWCMGAGYRLAKGGKRFANVLLSTGDILTQNWNECNSTK